MSSPTTPSTPTARSSGPRPGVRAAKRVAITEGARTVFGREGYDRTTIEAIAAEAGVSTRTIYNHFGGKEQLFSDVVQASANQVADAFIETVERQLAGADPEADLVALGRAFVGQRTQFPEHFAMIRQIKSEVAHFPVAVIDAWQQAGPLRVQREVARRLEQLAEAGLLRFDDPARATVHFIALVSSEITIRAYGRAPLSPAQIADSITHAVTTFLHGYGGA
ncbi:TetR/AcrR family transcriptional regulator [Streptacidiphilus sp. PAMC 29251]